MTRDRFLELRHFTEVRFLTREEVIELFTAVDTLQAEILSGREALYKALDADDAEAHELPLRALIERLELDLDVEYEQRIEAERKLKVVAARLAVAGSAVEHAENALKELPTA